MKQHPLSAAFPAMSEGDWLRHEVMGRTSIHETAFAFTAPSLKAVGFVDCRVINGATSYETHRPISPLLAREMLEMLIKDAGMQITDFVWQKRAAQAVGMPLTVSGADEAETEKQDEASDAESNGRECVYFVVAGDFVKIGKATGTPHKRLNTLQTGCPYQMRLAGYLAGGLEVESYFHRLFAKYRARDGGEWFRMEGELSCFVKILESHHA